MKSIMPGDLNFTYNPHSPLSQAIAQNTHANISHVQCVLDVGHSGTLYVMSAEAEGLVPKWVIPETLDWQATLTCPKLTLKERDGITNWLWANKETPYDFIGLISFIVNIDLNDEARLFCSESVFEAYLIGAGVELLTGIDHCYLSPRDIYVSPLLVTLDGSPKEVR